MKKHLPFLAIVLFTINSLSAQTWQYVGSGGISAGSSVSTSLAIDPSGTPYVAFADNNYLPTVMKWNGTSWQTLGNAGFEGNTTNNISITIDKNGTPYVAYEDGTAGFNGLNGRLTVIKWNGSSWGYVGSPGISDSEAVYFSITCDPTGIPYVAYTNGANPNTGAYGSGIVKKWNGSSWVTVGAPSVNTDLIQVSYPTVGFDPSGNPCLAYYSGYNNMEVFSNLQGGYWNPQGSPLPWVTQDVAQYISIAFDASGTPYVGFQDNFHGATVMKLVNQVWTSVGTPGFTSTDANYLSFVIDKNGTPYIAYQAGSQGKAAVEKWDGSSWAMIGTGYITVAEADYTSLAIDANGTPYLAFVDYFNSQKVTVMRYGTATTGITTPTETELSIYPNPAKNEVHVQYELPEKSETQVSIIDMLGNVVYHYEPIQESGTVTKTVNTSALSTGIYLIQVKVNGEVVNRKVCVE